MTFIVLVFFQPVFVIATGKQAVDKDTYTPLDEASSALQKKGATVFVLGIGEDPDYTELNQIASGPDKVFTVESFEDLEERADELKRGICILGIRCKIVTSDHYLAVNVFLCFSQISISL